MHTFDGEHRSLLPYLSAHTRQAYEFEKRTVRLDSHWIELAELQKSTSIHQRANKLLKLIEIRTHQAGDFVTLDTDWDCPLVDATNWVQVFYFLEYWEELGCLATKPKAANVARLTVKGWDRLDPASVSGGIPGQVFIAMSFDASLDGLYERGIKAAIEIDCRMSPVRIDRIQHGEKICDKILAEIRRSQIVVADFTMHKAGVYFEAGFALALGRTVIWTCQEDAMKDAHFDTRQYPHILWSDAADLRVISE